MAVDDKIVSIKFDNASFERKMSETLASLDKLRSGLNMSGAKKSLSDLGTAAKGVNLDPMGVSVDGVNAKFLALSTVAVTALATITSRAIDAGSRLVSSLSLAPVMQGFEEYELNMNSIQTILANTSSKGATLQDVNDALDEMNTYSDQTIYNFAQMAKNVGTFTAAGLSLDESTNSIKGIANLAAISGSSSDQASTAMYQLSQALAAGKVNLQDWNSVVNAGMGGEVFKTALFETGKAMRTITDVPVGASFDEWEKKGGTFREQMQSGWLTAEVLSTTLSSFSGELDKAGLKALGFGDAAADEMIRLGALGVAAATEVKTASQLMDTIKEAIASGWSATFRTVIGDFEQAKGLFTYINNAVGGFVGAQADARNEVLTGWEELGGRGALLVGLNDAFKALFSVLRPIGAAFRDIFPRKTAEELRALTERFRNFTAGLEVSEGTARKIGDAFRGFFALLSIGWEIIKGVTRVIFAIGKALWDILSPLFSIVSGTGNFVTGLHAVLVEGESVSTFFDGFIKLIEGVASAIAGVVSNVVDFVASLDLIGRAADILERPIAAFKSAGEAIGEFFSNLSFGGGESEDKLEKTSESMDKTTSTAKKFVDALMNVFSQIGDFFGGLVSGIAGAFSGLGGAIAGALGSGNFSQVLDILKVGLLGGIFLTIKKFLKNFSLFDNFGAGITAKLEEILGTLNSGLKSLQAEVRAETLLKIAGAVGILAIAVIALSLVDGEALAKGMAAIAAGFAQLTAVMLVLENASQGGGALKIAAMAAGMVLLAIAMALLVIPIVILSRMDPLDLAKGLAGVAAGLLVMSEAIYRMGDDPKGLIKAAISMGIMSLALILLARAVKKFADIGVVNMAIGMASAAIGITLLLKALERMPKDFEKKAGGMILLVLALRGLAKVVEIFAAMSIAQLATGFLAIAIGLELMGYAMSEFPDDMIEKAAAVIILSGALYLIGMAIEKVGSLPWETLVKGVLALSVMLGVLSIALILMEETEKGVIALLAASVGLLIMGHAIEQVGSLDIGTLLKGILGMAAALAVLAVASLAAPGILILGVALMAIGAGFLFIGVGAAALGKGLELAAKFGRAGLGHLMDAMRDMIRAVPSFVAALVQGFIDGFVELGERVPEIVEVIKGMMIALLDAIQEILPEIGDTITAFIDEIIGIFIDAIPDFVDAGFAMLMGWLEGIEENISEIIETVGSIISQFLQGFTAEMPQLIADLTDLIITAIEEVAFAIGRLAPTMMFGVARSLIEGFVQGISEEAGKIGTFITDVFNRVIQWVKDLFGISSPSTVFMDIGKDIIQGLINGVESLVSSVVDFFTKLPGKVINAVGNVLSGVGSLVGKGKDIIQGLWNGVKEIFAWTLIWFSQIPTRILNLLKGAGEWLIEIGKDIVRGLKEGLEAAWDEVTSWFKASADELPDVLKDEYQSNSPSKLFMGIGYDTIDGFGIGMAKAWKPLGKVTGANARNIVEKMNETIGTVAKTLEGLDMDDIGIKPTITPVLDLSKVQAGAKDINGLVAANAISADVSLRNARVISAASSVRTDDTQLAAPAGQTILNFEQHNHSPQALSTADIYRNTKNQIVLAKEELSIK